MKTAISVPDITFARVDERAKELGISRSEFYATAAEHYLIELDRGTLTKAINAAIDAGADPYDADVVAAGRRVLLESEW